MGARARPGVLAAVLAVCCTACGEAQPGPASGAAKAAVPPVAARAPFVIPAVDPQAPLPALSAAMLDTLAAAVPELAARREAILAAERVAIRNVLAPKKSPAKGKGGKGAPSRPVAFLQGILDRLVASAQAAEGAFGQGMIVGHNFLLLFGNGISGVDATKGNESRSIELVEGGKVAASATYATENGQVVATLQTHVDLPLFFAEANSRLSVAGHVCPAADGKVQFTLKLVSTGKAGQGGAATRERNIEVRVDGQVDDEARLVDASFDVKQATRSSQDGRQAYVESATTARLPGGTLGPVPPGKVTRASSQVTDVERRDAAETLNHAVDLATGALQAAQGNWQGGGCIKIKATSPGRVAPRSTSRIPVSVTHVKDGAVAAKVAVSLEGAQSVAPDLIPKAPGEVTHVAAAERNATMRIKLVATSRRGKDTAYLNLFTGGDAFDAAGGLQDFHGTGVICDIAAPFTIAGSGVQVEFQPTSARAGTYSYTGAAAGATLFGKGTYTVTYQGETPVGITGTGVGSVRSPMGVFSASGTEKYRLTPRDPC